MTLELTRTELIKWYLAQEGLIESQRTSIQRYRRQVKRLEAKIRRLEARLEDNGSGNGA